MGTLLTVPGLIFYCLKLTIVSSKTPFFYLPLSNLDSNLRNSDIYGTFKNIILKFIRPSPKSVFDCHNPQGIRLRKFLTRLRLGLSHLREYKFKYSFQDLLNPLYKCGAEV